MKYLVDANVLSEPTRTRPEPSVLEWLQKHESAIAVDPFILGENPFGKKRTALERWFQEGIRRVHCQRWEPETGLRWAALLADLRKRGRAMPIKDSLIAATALTYGLVVVTRNERDFEAAGVDVINPFR